MKLPALVRSLWAALSIFQVMAAGLNAEVLHCEQLEYVPAIVTKYRLIDVGETELDVSKLSSLPARLSLAPRINNLGQATANRQQGGFVFLSSRWEYVLRINEVKINIHAVNDRGDLLVGLNRASDSLEWMLWPLNNGEWGKNRKNIQTVDPFQSEFVFTALHEDGTVVGYKKNDGKNKPFIWTAENGFQPLGIEKGLKLSGVPRKINKVGSIAGIIDDVTDRCPFLWDAQVGLEVMRNYRQVLAPKGWVEFADIVLTGDDMIYGTFWIKHRSENNPSSLPNAYYAYNWEPKTGKVSMIELNGMRLASVNKAHVLVGSSNGHAMIRELGRSPIELAALMDPEELTGWELLEATSINDQGQIVGYGRRDGKMHIFFAEPT